MRLNRPALGMTFVLAAIMVGVNWGKDSPGTVFAWVTSFLVLTTILNVIITRGKVKSEK